MSMSSHHLFLLFTSSYVNIDQQYAGIQIIVVQSKQKVTSGLINQNDQKGLWWKMGGGADQLQWHVYLKLDIAKFQ